MSKRLAIAAMVASFWILPFGLGYLFLKQWAKFVLALLAVTIGQSLLASVIGRQSASIVVAVLWIATIADTFRIAIPHVRTAA